MRRYLTPLILLLGAVLSAQQAPDRSHPPQPGPVPALNMPPIQKRQLSNGLPVWIVELHEVPVAQINLLVLSGSADDPPGRFGAASVASAMLEEGAGSRTALEIADAIDFLGADLTTGSGIDSSAVRLHVPVARLADALPIMADVALHPTFKKEELDRLRQQRLTALIQGRDDPQTIASTAFPRVLYGPRHRYGTPSGGTAETIKTFTPEDLREFYTSTFRPDRATILAAGDLTPDRVMPLLEKSFGGWKAQGAAAPRQTIAAVDQPAARQVYLIDKPGAAQSQIRIGWIGVPRSTPDYFPLVVMNTILGGSFSSRLNMNLREQHGYTYGASSNFDMRAAAGPFAAAAGVQTDKTRESLTEFFNELNGILKPIPAEELSRAKNYVALRYPGGFETTGDISRQLENALVFHLPDTYFSTYVQNIQAVTAADVQRVAQKYIAPGRFAVVVVGDQKAIEPGIRALNLGPITVMTVDEVFGPKP
ncbi:MAG: insulinase family protein [Acidobacteria bacterium]|nr:insulinase family protein [Acidobacteriota bacterium]